MLTSVYIAFQPRKTIWGRGRLFLSTIIGMPEPPIEDRIEQFLRLFYIITAERRGQGGNKKNQKMKRFLVLAGCLFTLTCACFAQDVIVTRDSRKINAIVTQVNEDNIRFKYFDNPNGSTYMLKKSDVVTIIYENGNIETFGTESVRTQTATPAPAQSQPQRTAQPQQYQSQNQRATQTNPYQTQNQRTVQPNQYGQYQDVVYLKNGSMIRGVIIEQVPNRSVKMETADGNIFVFQMDEIETISKAPVQTQRTAQANQYQREYATHFSQFHAGLAFPSGKFSDGNSSNPDWANGRGFAATGFTIGYKYYGSASAQNLYWVFGIEAFYNDLNSDFKDATENNNSSIDYTFPKYLNFPATFGLNYSIPVSETAKIYGEGALGANLSLLTNFGGSYNNNRNNDFTIIFTPAFGFAYGIEGGCFFNQKYSVSIRYNNLGSYKYKYEYRPDQGTSTDGKFNKALPIANVSLCVGVLF